MFPSSVGCSSHFIAWNARFSCYLEAVDYLKPPLLCLFCLTFIAIGRPDPCLESE